MRYLVCSAWLAAVWLLVSATALADPPSSSRILLVVDERAQPLATRVAAELETLGFSVETQTRELDPAELAVAARGASAFAAIGIGPTAAGTVEITVLDRVTGKTVRRELLGRSLEDPTTRELVALRASELLRASLMEIEAPHPPRGEVPPTPAVVRVARAPETLRRPDRRWRLGVEGGALLAPGLAFSPLLQATFGVRLVPALELGVAVGSQLTPGERSAELGRVESTARWLSAGPKLLLLPRRDERSAVLGLEGGLAVLALTASGFASEPGVQGASRFVWSPAGWLGIDSKIRIHKQLWWSFRPAVGYTTRALAVQADGRELKVWGRPWLWCSTGVEVEL